MPDPSQDKTTYNEEMRRWMAKQSFWHRLKYGRHPGNHSRLFAFVFKTFMTLAVLVAVVVTVYVIAVKKRVGSAEFFNDFGSAFTEDMGTRGVVGQPLTWDNGVARISSLELTGGRSNFFSRLNMEMVSFPLGFMDVVSGEWEIESLEGRGVDISLRSGAFTDREWKELLIADPVEQEAGGNGWMSPTVDLSKLNHLAIRDLNARWGAKAWMAGSLIACDLDATRNGDVWKLHIKGGQFSQNWIKNLQVEKILLEVTPSEIKVVEGKMKLPSGGVANINGTISYAEDDPEFDLLARFTDLQFVDIISNQEALVLTGELQGDVRITGSANRNEGLASKGRLLAEAPHEELEDLALRNRPWLLKLGRNIEAELPVFRAFGDGLGADGIRFFTSERSVIDFETSQGNLKVTEMSLYDPMVGYLTGEFSYEGKTKSVIDGSLTLTLKDKVFENNRELREVRAKLFSNNDKGESQFLINMQGPIDGLTRNDAQRVLELADTVD